MRLKFPDNSVNVFAILICTFAACAWVRSRSYYDQFSYDLKTKSNLVFANIRIISISGDLTFVYSAYSMDGINNYLTPTGDPPTWAVGSTMNILSQDIYPRSFKFGVEFGVRQSQERLFIRGGHVIRIDENSLLHYRLAKWTLGTQSFLAVKYYMLLFLPLLYVIGVIGIRLCKKKMFSKGLCQFCGYDLRATPNRCPECGRLAGINK